MVHTTAGSDELVGRGEELARTNRVLAEAMAGSGNAAPHVLAVTGDPGIGKTRLLAELSAQARAQDRLVIGGSATEFERRVPFAALAELLEGWVRCGDRRTVRSEPLVRALLRTLSSAQQDDFGADSGSWFGLHRRTRAIFEELATPHGLVVVLDDLHWADAALVELIGSLICRPPRARCLLALGYRPRQVDRRIEEAVCCTGAVERLELHPLSANESRELLGAGVGQAAAERLFRESGGNPLFLKALHRAGNPAPDRLPDGIDELPPAVHTALASEIRGLSAIAAKVADAAAVAGDPFEYGLVSAIADVEEAETVRFVDELVKRDLIRQIDAAPRFGFRHPLLRCVVYTAMSAGARREAHHRAAVTLARHGAPLLARAHHVARSACRGDDTAAALLADAAHATLVHAPATAASLLEESLRLLPADPRWKKLRHERTLGLARALTLTGRLSDGRNVAHTLLAQLPGEAITVRAQAAIVTAMADRLLGQYRQGRAVLRTELGRLGGHDHPAAVSIMLELVTNGLLAGDFEGKQQDILGALTAAEGLGDRPLRAAAATVQAFASYATGRYADALTQLDTATELVEALAPSELACRLDVAVWLAWTELFLERYELAIYRFNQALTLMRVTGQGHLLTYAMVGLSQAYVQSGQLGQGVEWAANAVEAAELSASDELRTMAYTLSCLAATYVGNQDTALWAGARAMAAAGPVADWWGATAGMLFAQARLVAGHKPAECLENMLIAGGGPELSRIDPGNRPNMYQALARAELAHGGPTAALAWVDRMDAAVAELGPGARGRAATAELLRAEILLLASEPAESANHAQHALNGFTSMGNRFFVGRAYLALGRALTATGNRADGLAQLQHAQAIFTDIGAHRYVDKAIRAQRQRGRRAVRDPGGVSALTRRETEVALLVAEGHRNRRIAQQLLLSERTVETHIRHIGTKLDVSSRAAIAAAIARHEQTP